MQPGIVTDVTAYMAEGGWVDSNLIRFRNGRAEKVGGWVRESTTKAVQFGFSSGFSSGFAGDTFNDAQSFTGVARAMKAWTALDGSRYLAVATHQKVELLSNGIIYDITPIRESVTLEDAISTTSGLSTVTITDVNHNLVAGDFIFVNTQDVAVDGVTLYGEYTVESVTDADNYVIDSRITASGTTALAGDTLTIDYLLEVGSENNGGMTGWGGGTWGSAGSGGGGWGMPRESSDGLKLRQWSLDNWGEDLLACVRDGKIYKWDATTGPSARLTVLSGAPVQNSFILVAQPSRHLIAFGSEVFSTSIFDPMIIRWASQESLTDWDSSDPLNTAGEYRLPQGNYIVGALQTRGEILVFTDTDVYSMRYIGGDDIFQFQPLGTNISTVSQHSMVDLNGVAFWKGVDNFYMYDGLVRVLASTVAKYIFDEDGDGRINFFQKEKTYCGINKEFNEIWWFYPKYDETECSNYIKYNYAEQVWDYGVLERTAWIDKGTFEKPYGINADGVLYVHEVGKDNDSQPMDAYITTAYFDIDDGEQIMFVDRIVPDIRLPANRNIEISILTKKYPHPNATIITKGPYFFDDSDTKISTRARGRQMALHFESNATGGDFEIGKIRLGFQTDGER